MYEDLLYKAGVDLIFNGHVHAVRAGAAARANLLATCSQLAGLQAHAIGPHPWKRAAGGPAAPSRRWLCKFV